jgi:hypothetical protein
MLFKHANAIKIGCWHTFLTAHSTNGIEWNEQWKLVVLQYFIADSTFPSVSIHRPIAKLDCIFKNAINTTIFIFISFPPFIIIIVVVCVFVQTIACGYLQ